MKTILAFIFVGWIASMGLARAYSMKLDAVPLPMELQNTSHDPEEVCINGQCEAEQD